MNGEITLKIGHEIRINGDTFPVMLDEVEIIEAAEKIQAEARTIEQTPAGIRAFGEKLTSFVDSVLGEGGVAKIAKGRKIGITTLLGLVSLLADDITRQYAATLAEYAPPK
jgi:hypothetical protein